MKVNWLARRVLDVQAMQELSIEQMNVVTGGTAADGKPYTPAQLKYIKQVTGLGKAPTLPTHPPIGWSPSCPNCELPGAMPRKP